jgi:hypothetical protein
VGQRVGVPSGRVEGLDPRSSPSPTDIPTPSPFLSGISGVSMATLGIDDFGQSGDVDDLFRHFGIDAETIVGAAADLVL